MRVLCTLCKVRSYLQATSAKSDVLLGTGNPQTPTLVTPHPRSPAGSLQATPFQSGEQQGTRPMSLPHLPEQQK